MTLSYDIVNSDGMEETITCVDPDFVFYYSASQV